jgi:two-component system NtrC family sensor kinase
MSKLLLIDDEESILRVLSLSLKSDGHEVTTAQNGEEGLRLFQEETPDIVLTDLKMPGMDGLEVLKKAKEHNPDAEVIVITGHGDMDSAIEALQQGASDFINKPIRDEVLTVSLERAEEKLAVRKKLKEYTSDLEDMIQIATEEVKRKSEFQHKLITSSPDAIIATDEKGEIVIFNPGAERLFGYPRFEVIGEKTLYELYPAEIAEEFREALAQDKEATEGLRWRETVIVEKGGQAVPVGFSGALIHESGRIIGSVAFFHDLREIKRLEQELVTSERLAAIGQTTAGLAHYIKNILAGLKGGTHTLNVGLDKNSMEKVKKGWPIIQNNVVRISNLVADLLSYSKEREPEFETCLPNEIAEDVCQLMEEKAKQHHVEIGREFDESVGEAVMDPKTLHRSLLNLVSNAIDACIFDDATEKRWQIQVRTLLEDDNRIRVEVIDNGGGMSDEVKERLFTSFFSTKGGQGTGLGLLVTQKLIREHGGEITFASEEGEGSTFTVRLPYKSVID